MQCEPVFDWLMQQYEPSLYWHLFIWFPLCHISLWSTASWEKENKIAFQWWAEMRMDVCSVVTTTKLSPPRGGWLPLNQHCHHGVLQCSRRSFWVLFPPKKAKTAPHVRRAVSRLNATLFDPVIWSRLNAACRGTWTHGGQSRHCPLYLVQRPLPHSQTTALPGQRDNASCGHVNCRKWSCHMVETAQGWVTMRQCDFR